MDYEDDDENDYFVPNKRVTNSFNIGMTQINFVDDSTNNHKITDLLPEHRVVTEESNITQYMGYPQKYKDLYEEERVKFVFTDQDVEDVTDVKLFIRGSDQLSMQTRIKQDTNINCISSREVDDPKNLYFSEWALNILSQEYGREFISFKKYLAAYSDEIFNLFQSFIDEDEDEEDDEDEEQKKKEKWIKLREDRYKCGFVFNERIRSHIFPEDDDPRFKIINEKIKRETLEFEYNMTKLIEKEEMLKGFSIDSIDSFRYLKFMESGDMVELYEKIQTGYMDKLPQIHDCIIVILKHLLGPYSQYVVAAGGFSLSQYMERNYRQKVPFADVDLFIHSCSEEQANEIINHLKVAFSTYNGPDVDDNFTENENVINIGGVSMNGILGVDDADLRFFNYRIQLIKRLYSCPAQIITGFDVDCCCILTNMDNRIFVTKRGKNAIINGYNVLNFEKLSPSYEYRLLKYNKRGFGIWIPFIEHFKENTLFDANCLDKTKGSTIIIKDLIRGSNRSKNISDYDSRSSSISDFVRFKTFEPGKQTINTFHRKFMDDFLKWYPELPVNCLDNLTLKFTRNIIELKPSLNRTLIFAKNIRRRIKYISYTRDNSDIIKHNSFKMIEKIEQFNKDITILGEIPKRAVLGESSEKLSYTFWTERPLNDDQKKLLEYNLTIYQPLLTIRNLFIKHGFHFDDSQIDSIGRVVFVDNTHNLNIDDDENYENYKKYLKSKYYSESIRVYSNELFQATAPIKHKEIKPYLILNPGIVDQYTQVCIKETEYIMKKFESENYISFQTGDTIGMYLLITGKPRRDIQSSYDRYNIKNTFKANLQESFDLLVTSLFHRHLNYNISISTNDKVIPLIDYIENFDENTKNKKNVGAVMYTNGRFYGIEEDTANLVHSINSNLDVFDDEVWRQYIKE